MKLAVVIPSYNDAQGLWFTVAAARVDLEADFAPDEYEIIGVVDGPDDEETQILHGMRQQGTCRMMRSDTRTPQKNRHAGLLATEAPYVFFLDSHVVPSRGYFKRLLMTAEETGAAIVHGAHSFWSDGRTYAYAMDWKNHFWSHCGEALPQRTDGPYRIGIAGHGGIVVNREKYLSVGGYWDALQGWGGEEPQLNFKLWMMGHEAYLDPRVYHWHLMVPRRHRVAEQLTAGYVRNFLLVAYATGGQKYLDAVHMFYTQSMTHYATIEEAMAAPPRDPWQDVFDRIPEEAAQERELICRGPYGGNLDALRDYFRKEGIPN